MTATNQNRQLVAAAVIRGVIARLGKPVDLVNGSWKTAAVDLGYRVGEELAILAGVAEELEKSGRPDPAPKLHAIILNGRPRTVGPCVELAYEALVEMARVQSPGLGSTPTMTVQYPETAGLRDRAPHAGQMIVIVDGTVIDVMDTGAA